MLSVPRAQLLFFFSGCFRLSSGYQYNIAKYCKNIRYKYMHCVGSCKYTKMLQDYEKL
jgi:hypothetical protein